MNSAARKLVKAWHELATEDSIPALSEHEQAVFRFTASWVAFNAYLTSEYATVRGDERKVLHFAGQSQPKATHLEKLSEPDYAEAVATLKEHSVTNMRDGTLRRIEDRMCFSEVMSCIYRVRCNLFHGNKSVDDERDLALVKSAHTIVAAHVGRVLE